MVKYAAPGTPLEAAASVRAVVSHPDEHHCAEQGAGISIPADNAGLDTLFVPELPKILLLNGPNLNMLGVREPEVYGTSTLADIERMCRKRTDALGVALDFRQSNSEAELVGWIQTARGSCDALIINPAAFTHSSIAILDALSMLDIPIIELHLSNFHRRESFRHQSYVSMVAAGIICGFGESGYELAIDAAARMIGTEGIR